MKQGFATLIIPLTAAAILSAAIFILAASIKQKDLITPLSYQSVVPGPYFGWKVYNNKTYNFTIRYPKQWHLKEYQDTGANFYNQDPQEATSAAIKVRFLASGEKADTNEFEKIEKLKEGQQLREPLDVKSTITKIKNFTAGSHPKIEYEIERFFSALQGPKTEFSHVYKINQNGIVLTFSSSDQTKEEQQKIDPIFKKMIESLKFF